MTEQDNKLLLGKLKEITDILGSPVKVRSRIGLGFTFVPTRVGVPEAFCTLYNSSLAYQEMRLCQSSGGQYWIDIRFSNIPLRDTLYWNGKKFVKYDGA